MKFTPGPANDSIYPEEKIRTELEKQGDNNTAFGDKSPGVRRIEAVSQCFQSWHKYVLFISIFLVAYSYGLDGSTRYTYQNQAVYSFNSAAQISTVNVVKAIVAAAAQPVYAKISDYFGRISILFISIIFYLIGTILTAAAHNLGEFSGGSLLYQFGYTGTQLLVEVIIADTTSLRSRLFFSYIPATPFLINAWISGNITQSIADHSSWRWGVGMWAIIFPVCCIPLLYSLVHAEMRAHKAGLLDNVPNPYRSLGRLSLWSDFFWQIDVIGLLLLAASLALILLPFTLAGGVSTIWKTAKVIAPLVIGVVVALPGFIIWELKFAKHPVMPFRILKDRQIVSALLIAMLLNTAWATQADYLYQTLTVAFDRDVESATRVQNVYSFVSVVIGVCLGLVVRYVRRLKYFVVAGTCCFVLAFGLLIRFRGGTSTSDFAGIVGGEVVLGIAGGLFPYPTQVLIQTAVQHERTAVITSLYLASYSVGSAIGNTIAAGIFTNEMPKKLAENWSRYGISNTTEIADAYGNPGAFILKYSIGTPERSALNDSFREVQRLLCIAGISISALLVLVSLGLKNPRLGDSQSLGEAEGFTVPTLNNGGNLEPASLPREGEQGEEDGNGMADVPAKAPLRA